jgi:hypothetical protein
VLLWSITWRTSVSLPSRWLHYVDHSVGESILAYPLPFASSLKCDFSWHDESSSQYEQSFPWLPYKLCLTPYVGNSTAGSLLTDWQVAQIAALPWIVLIHPSASQARTCKMESGIPYGVAKEPNYNIPLEQMMYYSRYAIRKKCVMLGFSMPQWVTSEPEGCWHSQGATDTTITLFILATWHSIARVYPPIVPWPIKCVESLTLH